MRRARWTVSLLAGLGLCGCPRTAPPTPWPPPGPSDGLPVAPMPEPMQPTESPPAAPAPATAKPPSAIDGALPSTPPTSLERAHACKQKECRLGSFVPEGALPKDSPTPGTLWAEELAAGSALVLPRHHQLEVLAVVLTGDVLASADEGGAAQKLGAWVTLRAPGSGVSLRAGDGGAKLILGVAAAKGSLGEALTRAAAKPFEVRWKKRPSPLLLVALSSAKDLAWAAGAFHARIAFGGEIPIAGSLGVLQSSADAAIKEHDHPTWEHVAILRGSGTMTVDGQARPVRAGSVFDIPPGVKHAFAPSGDQGLLAVQCYTPSGPEQRFVKLAEEAGRKPAAAAK